MLSVSFSLTVPPSGYWAAASASTSEPFCSASLATLRTKSWNSSFLATKSVSELTSTAAPRVPSTATPTRPSAAVRPAFLAAAARPLARSQSIEASISPLFSASAFLQSIMPAPVRSRSSFTEAAVISAMCNSSKPPSRLREGLGVGALSEKWERQPHPSIPSREREGRIRYASAASAGGSAISPTSWPRAWALPERPSPTADATDSV